MNHSRLTPSMQKKNLLMDGLITIEKELDRLADGAIGFTVDDGKAIMAHLQKAIVQQQCETWRIATLSAGIDRSFGLPKARP